MDRRRKSEAEAMVYRLDDGLSMKDLSYTTLVLTQGSFCKPS